MKKKTPGLNNPLSQWCYDSGQSQSECARRCGMQPAQFIRLARIDNPNPTLETMLRVELATYGAVRLEDWRR